MKMKMNWIPLLLILNLILVILPFSVTEAKDEEIITYIKSKDGTKEIPLSVLKDIQGKGSTIYKAYKGDSNSDIPCSSEEAFYFPIKGSSLDSIISFLQYGIISYEDKNLKTLRKDINKCKMFNMELQLTLDIKEKRLLRNYPELRKIKYYKPTFYNKIILSIAAFSNDREFFQYMMSKYNIKGMLLRDFFSFEDENLLNKKRLPLDIEDFRTYTLSPKKISILQIVATIDRMQKGVLSYLLEQDLTTKEEIESISYLETLTGRTGDGPLIGQLKYDPELEKIKKKSPEVYHFVMNTVAKHDDIAAPQTITDFRISFSNKKIVTSTGEIYKKIVNNLLLGNEAWLEVSSGSIWSTIAPNTMNFQNAKNYCANVITYSSRGLKCRLPHIEEYKKIGKGGNKAYKKITNSKGLSFWTFENDNGSPYLFNTKLGILGYDQFLHELASHSVRCICQIEDY